MTIRAERHVLFIVAVLAMGSTVRAILPAAEACPGDCGTAEPPDKVVIECTQGCVRKYESPDAVGAGFTQWRPQLFYRGVVRAGRTHIWSEELDRKMSVRMYDRDDLLFSDSEDEVCNDTTMPTAVIGCQQVCHLVANCLAVICPEQDESIGEVCGLLPPHPSEAYKPSVIDQAVIQLAPPAFEWLPLLDKLPVRVECTGVVSQKIYVDSSSVPIAEFCWLQDLTYYVDFVLYFGWSVDSVRPYYLDMSSACLLADLCLE